MVGPMPDDDHCAITVSQAKSLFADWKSAPAVVLAVSGGPDSIALMWLAARWRRALTRGPRLIALTVDHGLRPEAAREARDVKRAASELDLPHRTLRWPRRAAMQGIWRGWPAGWRGPMPRWKCWRMVPSATSR